MNLLLIRHGESLANAEGRWQGTFDSPLSDRGRDQARVLTRRLRREGWPVAAIYASDLSRASETAEILAAGLDAPLYLDSRLQEYDAGVLNGILVCEAERLYPDLFRALETSPEWVPIPGEEGTAAFLARIVSMLDEIRARHREGEVVAIVSHGGIQGTLLAHLLGLDPHRPTPFRFGNTSLSIVEFTPRGPRLALLNDTSHLDGDLR